MSQTLLTCSPIAKEAMSLLETKLKIAGLCSRTLEKEYKRNAYQKGEQIQVAVPVEFTLQRDNLDLTNAIQQIQERTETFDLNKTASVGFAIPALDLQLDINGKVPGDVSERYIKPAVVKIANEIEKTIFDSYKEVYNANGGGGADALTVANMDSHADVGYIDAVMTMLNIPDEDRHLILDPGAYATLTGNLAGLYIAQAGPAYASGKLPKVSGFEIHRSNLVPYHTAGTQTTGANTVDTTLTKSSTLNQISVSGLDNNLVVGDVFTIGSVYDVHPITKQALSRLKRFVVTTALTATGTTDTITFAPRIVMSDDNSAGYGPGQQNVSAYPVAAAAVVFAASHHAQLAFHKNAFHLVNPPLMAPTIGLDTATQTYQGLSLTVTKGSDGIQFKNYWRIDALWGCKCLDPRLAVRVLGS